MSLPKILSCHLILMLSAFTGAANGYYNSNWFRCIHGSRDLSDMVFIFNYVFNKDVFIQFNSTVGEFVGYTELGVRNADRFNKDPSILNRWRGEKDRYCTHNAEIRQSAIADKTV
ncbi:hypothetical protein DOZ52_29220, partial [Enterobacter hormaechei]|uniref:class II histocompatibility antigen beta chain family protein n=1 Tax=Enterobacter hormaechei TaxID=158836 RepID=UPI000DC00327